MKCPDNLLYTKDHEWILINGNIATIGITNYAQEQLGDIVYVDLPAKGQDLKKTDTFGVVESVKSVSDCLAPLSGTVEDINDSLVDNPAMLNEEPYGEGWIIKIKINNLKEKEELLNSTDYEAFVKEESA